MTTTTAHHEADEILLGFTRALRAAGVRVTGDQAQEFLRAVSVLGLDSAAATHAAGRATVCAGPEDLARYDQVFAAWFDGTDLPRPGRREEVSVPARSVGDDEGGDAHAEESKQGLAASTTEVLRHRDVAALSAAEKRLLTALFAQLRPTLPVRRTARHHAWHRGCVDASRTLRTSLRRMGEPSRIVWRRRGSRPRRMVLLLDVSGSMSGYADPLLRLAQRFVLAAGDARSVEVFTLGTRLTRISTALRLRDANRAIVAAGEAVPDWSGGTRLGETLGAFLDRWGARGMARGAVVVVFSDGWERGDASELGQQAARLHRLAHRVLWVNPHRGKPGYEPVQQGVRAVLPHVDDFLAGHSLATFEELVEVVGRA